MLINLELADMFGITVSKSGLWLLFFCFFYTKEKGLGHSLACVLLCTIWISNKKGEFSVWNPK